MLPIPVLSPNPAIPGVPGIVPGVAPPSIDFAALLPGGVTPVMPRQRDGESGSDLPATPGKDAADTDKTTLADWIVPPAWLVSCPPPEHPGAEVSALADTGAGAVTATSSLPLTPEPLAEPLVSPSVRDVLTGSGLPHAGAAAAEAGPARDMAPADPDAPREAPAQTEVVTLALSSGAAEVPNPAVVASPAPSILAAPTLATVKPDRGSAVSVPALDLATRGAAASTAEPILAAAAKTQPAANVSPIELSAARHAPGAATPMMMQHGVQSGDTAEAGAAAATGAPLSAPTAVLTPPVPAGPEQSSIAEKPGAVGPDLRPAAPPLVRGDAPAATSAGKDQPVPPAPAPVAGSGILQAITPAQVAVAGQVAPAAQVFAAAMHRAARDDRSAAPAEMLIAGAVPTTDLAPHAVGAIEGARHAALDMAHDAWPAKMIDRIESLRDAMNAVDTSIRLIPDKLGTIDVTMRREGDAVAVHFNAQQAETRQLLADAQPKLAELAEARGLKLSGQTGQAGQGDGGQHHQHQRAPSLAPLSPARAGRISASDDAAPTDERIA